MNNISWLYVIVRKDMPVPNTLAQVGHVCAKAGERFSHPDNTHICILKVDNQSRLMEAANFLGYMGISFELFYESDFPEGFTAIATELISEDKRSIFGKFKTWDGN